MKLRCRHPNGATEFTLTNSSSVTTAPRVMDLYVTLASVTGIPLEQLKVKVGFPPKELLWQSAEQPVTDVGITEGEAMIIEKQESSNSQLQSLLRSTTEGRTNKETTVPEIPQEAAVVESKSVAANPPAIRSFTPSVVDSFLWEEVGAKPVRRVVPADNSCLFTAITYVCEGEHSCKNGGYPLRKVVADRIQQNPELYSAALLGKPPREYMSWILNREHWGGGIEVAILTDYFETMIYCVDIQTSRVDRFGESKAYPRCVYLIYDGIHYDALALQLGEAATEEGDITVFSPSDSRVFTSFVSLSHSLRQQRQFVDVSQFQIRCLVCSATFKGQKEASEHADTTGHQNFAEI